MTEKSREVYDSQTKAMVLAALLEGQSLSKIAEEYDIPYGTVRSWKSRYLKDAVSVTDPEQRAAIGDLLVEYLRESLLTALEQLRHFRDKDWLNEQGASELAVLHGVQMDKVMKIIEALNRAEPSD